MLSVPLLDLGQAGLEAGFPPRSGWLVETLILNFRGNRCHGGQLILAIVGILVALAVTQVGHQPGGSITDLQGNGKVARFLDDPFGPLTGGVNGVCLSPRS